jgi:hypothetical protein
LTHAGGVKSVPIKETRQSLGSNYNSPAWHTIIAETNHSMYIQFHTITLTLKADRRKQVNRFRQKILQRRRTHIEDKTREHNIRISKIGNGKWHGYSYPFKYHYNYMSYFE